MKSLIKRCLPLPLPLTKGKDGGGRGWVGGALRLCEGLFEVSHQHGRHDALLCVDGQQGGGGFLLLQRHQDQRSAADRPPGEPAGEEEEAELNITTTLRETDGT